MCLVAVHGPDTRIFTVIPSFFSGCVASIRLHNLNWQNSLNVGILCFISALSSELRFSLQRMVSWNQCFQSRLKTQARFNLVMNGFWFWTSSRAATYHVYEVLGCCLDATGLPIDHFFYYRSKDMSTFTTPSLRG